MFENKKIKYKGFKPDTRDIIHALCAAVPAGYNQININEWLDIATGEDAFSDGLNVAKWINQNIKYKADGYFTQNIQLPGRLLELREDNKADCKSFSLLFLSVMSRLGYKCGFRFASYRVNKKPTHVYNFVKDEKNNIFTFDACVKSLKENPNFTHIQDMEINYLSGTPIMTDTEDIEFLGYVDAEPGEKFFINGIEYEYLGKGLFKKAGEKLKKAIKKVGAGVQNVVDETKKVVKNPGKAIKEATKDIVKGVKKIGLAVPRNAFLGLVAINFRGLATRISSVSDKSKLTATWLKLGGNPDKLFGTAEKHKNQKAIFGKGGKIGIPYDYLEPDDYIGVIDTGTAAIIASAAPVLVAIIAALKKSGVNIPDEETADLPQDDVLGDFVATDAETPEAETIAEKATDFFQKAGAIFKGVGNFGTSNFDKKTYEELKPSEIIAPKTQQEIRATPSAISTGIKPTTILLGLGAVAAVYFLTQSKKRR